MASRVLVLVALLALLAAGEGRPFDSYKLYRKLSANSPTKVPQVTQPPQPTTLSPWRCVSDDQAPADFVPVRLGDSGAPECLAKDGKSCLWSNSVEACADVISTEGTVSDVTPLVCTPWEVAQPGTWCANFATSSPYFCVTDSSDPPHFTPVRFNAQGGVECYSNDGSSCVWADSAEGCGSTIADVSNGNKPHTCSASQLDNSCCAGQGQVHWCHKFLTATDWQCVSDEADTPSFVPVRYTGQAGGECLSLDGVSCIWGASREACADVISQSGQSPDLTPVACTRDLLASGDVHWCRGVVREAFTAGLQSSSEATSAHADVTDTPAPTDVTDTPAPTDVTDTPAPTDGTDTPAPSDGTDSTDVTVTSAPSDVTDTPAPTDDPVSPATSDEEATLADSTGEPTPTPDHDTSEDEEPQDPTPDGTPEPNTSEDVVEDPEPS